MVKEHRLSIRRACSAIEMARSLFYYQPQREDDRVIIDAIHAVLEKHPRYGFWAIFERLKRKGHGWNHKRVYRVYKALALNIRRRAKKRLPERAKQPLLRLNEPNAVWSMDFMSDSLYSGRRYRLLNIIDEFNRELLDVEADTSLPALRVIKTLERICDWRGKPKAIRVDNGPEFISYKLEAWCEAKKIDLQFNRPGTPTDNARIERFNGSFRRELLDAYIFNSLSEVRIMAEEWMIDYNTERSHDSLGKLTPIEFLERYNQTAEKVSLSTV
jgi:putative transposase